MLGPFRESGSLCGEVGRCHCLSVEPQQASSRCKALLAVRNLCKEAGRNGHSRIRPLSSSTINFPVLYLASRSSGHFHRPGGDIIKSKRGSGFCLCHANFASTDLEIALALENLDHKMTSLQVLVGKNQGSAQNRSRFCTWTLPCQPFHDSSVMPSAINAAENCRDA